MLIVVGDQWQIQVAVKAATYFHVNDPLERTLKGLLSVLAVLANI